MTDSSIKLVNTPHHHLWTDTLHARELAIQARNKWDRGTYVRWTVITVWTVIEIAFQEALEDFQISRRFKENVDKAISNKKLVPLDWGSGIWQKIRELQETRKLYIHTISLKDSQGKLFPDASMADNAIEIAREGIKAIYGYVGKTFPSWIDDNQDFGWDYGRKPALSYSVYPGADENDATAIKIIFVHKDREYLSEIRPPGTNPGPLLDDLILRIRLPVSAVKAYRGEELIEERLSKMRGA